MDIFDFFSMAGEIGGFFKAAGEDIGNLFNPKKKTKQSHFANREPKNDFADMYKDAYKDTLNDPGKKYWQDLLEEKLDAKEKENELISEMMIRDYEARHASEGNDEPKDSENAESSEADGSENPDENSGVEAGNPGESSGAFESDGSFESGFDSAFDSGSDCDSGDSGSCDGYIG